MVSIIFLKDIYWPCGANPRRAGHGGEVWQNVVHCRREWQATSVFLPWEPHEQYEFNSYDHYIYYCQQEYLRRYGAAIIVNKRVRNALLGCSLKNDRMISVGFQGKPFHITVIQVYTLTSNVKEAEVEQFYEDLQDLLELKPKKDVLSL